jgi:NADPH-dependent glutamate synthase beta subunit-like oxidoreductase/NAD(P)H-flavin reductase
VGKIAMLNQNLHLKGFNFPELFTADGLNKLDESFLSYLQSMDQLLYGKLLAFRGGQEFTPAQISGMVIEWAPLLEAFIAELFFIEDAVGQMQAATCQHDPIFAFKKYYVLREARRALKKHETFDSFSELDEWLACEIKRHHYDSLDEELAIATYGCLLLQEPKANDAAIKRLIQWSVQALVTTDGLGKTKAWVSFHIPNKLNYVNLVSCEHVEKSGVPMLQAVPSRHRERDGFSLTDKRASELAVLDEAHYCVYCHKTEGDFCSKGFPIKKNKPEQGLKINPLGETLTGCPLEEKISEMNWLKKSGYAIGALAIIMIDNPMCPATGHRICNDCMKACIYQKQEPVNIPEVETRVLTDVLSLPWGVEIYDLLTRWNPFRKKQWAEKRYNGKKVLVMGMGPAGFTLAHHLLMEGFAVVGMDGLKIEPVPADLINKPIYSYDSLNESLDQRVMTGFGGVAEYGITVRWDKNFLKLIYISLMRRSYFQVFGNIRFGGTLTVEDAWTLGFDHLAVAVGAGLPRELPITNSMAPGMRQANDFLMALQLTGAAKESSLANLQVRLPAVVIGGGLTGIDTATEVQAYYIKQVEKVLSRYTKLCAKQGEDLVRSRYSAVELVILDEFLMHGRQVCRERRDAQKASRSVNFIALIRSWGGVTLAYRRSMQESPAYRTNHEEVAKALEEGIYYAEGLEPVSVSLDEYGHANAIKFKSRVQDEFGNWLETDETQTLLAKAILVATGAKPNIAYEFEHKNTFLRKGFEYQRFNEQDGKLIEVTEKGHCKADEFGAFTSYENDKHRVTFLGDTHPVFHGSVVKAIASAARVYPKIVSCMQGDRNGVGDSIEYEKFKQMMDGYFQATVVEVKRHTASMVELKVRAPMAAHNFQPGQFYRVQNYETIAQHVDGTRLQTESMAMIAARDMEKDPDVLSLMALERGASSRLLACFKPGEPVALMGPTGVRCKIPTDTQQTIMIIGGSMAAFQLRSIGPALKAAGHRILFVSCMQSGQELHCREELEAVTDVILWLVNDAVADLSIRDCDVQAAGELILALRDYAMGHLTNGSQPLISLQQVGRIMVIGAPQVLRRVQESRTGLLKDFFHPDAEFSASVYGPMQCMMKGVCAQCLQWQIDPETGKRTKAVYACSWHEQPMDKVDIDNISERLAQNAVQETLTGQWLDHLFATYPVERI